MPTPDGRDLILLVDGLRSALGGVFWGLLLVGVVFFLDLVLLSTLLVRSLLGRERGSTGAAAARWSGVDLLTLYFFWLLAYQGLLGVIAVVPETVLAPPARALLGYIAGALVGVVGAVLAVGLACALHRHRAADLGLGARGVARGLGAGVVAYLAFLPGSYGVLGLWNVGLTLARVPMPPQAAVVEFHRALVAGDWPALAALIGFGTVAAPLWEEVFFRALLFGWLRERLSVPLAVGVSATIFGLSHFNLLAFLPTAALGVVLAALYHRTGNLWSCIALHAVFNAVQLLLLAWLV